MTKEKMRIVFVGGGFAGVNFTRRIANDSRFAVTLVDTNNYHFFPPLLYQVASAFIEPSMISYPFRRLFQKRRNIRFHLGTLLHVDTGNNTVVTDTGSLVYDQLVLAIGTESNFFGLENVRRHANAMKTINDSILLRNHLLLNMEKAARTSSAADREKFMNIVIAGGGPTGVEVAGMLAEMNLHIAKKDYPEFRDTNVKIHLVDAGNALLGPMSKKSQREAHKVLNGLGVKILLGVAVKDYDGERVVLSGDQVIPAASLIWATGVKGKEVKGLLADAVGRGARIIVNEFNQVKGTENIYALGDLCIQTSDPAFPEGYSQLAQVVIQQGKHLADNFKALASKKAMRPFRYNDMGSMAIISKFKAVTDFPKFFVRGFFAWLLWLFVHIIPIAGFRNKVRLAFSWFWSFISNDPTLRLIIRPRDDEHHH